MTVFSYTPAIALKPDDTPYRHLGSEHVQTVTLGGRPFLEIGPAALTLLAREALRDVSFYLRAAHLKKVAAILDDPEASDNDRYVAATLLKNSIEAARGILPTCQDTGTAIVYAKKGERVLTGGTDEEALSRGIHETFLAQNLRYSQMAPLSMFEEQNTGCNLPAQIDIHAVPGDEYHFLFLAKGGGSANKTFLFQQTKSLLNETALSAFMRDKVFALGTSACPPYHIALVIGGTSAEATLKAVKLASAGYYDTLPTSGDAGGRAFRDLEWEERLLRSAQESRIGAQFGGKYLAHDVRVIRLPRHAASCPVGLGVSCSADRNIKGKITAGGLHLEQLETHPEQYSEKINIRLAPPVEINLERPMREILAELGRHPVGTRLKLSGTLVVARDIAHARISDMLRRGQAMPEYLKQHPVYYAGPAKTPAGLPSGSFGPTTAGRMDAYVEEFQARGGSMVMLAKGNRDESVTASCKKHGGFYLGSIGGPAAILARESILKVEVIDFPELGMEAVRKIVVRDFPAFIVCDDKGGNLYAKVKQE